MYGVNNKETLPKHHPLKVGAVRMNLPTHHLIMPGTPEHPEEMNPKKDEIGQVAQVPVKETLLNQSKGPKKDPGMPPDGDRYLKVRENNPGKEVETHQDDMKGPKARGKNPGKKAETNHDDMIDLKARDKNPEKEIEIHQDGVKDPKEGQKKKQHHQEVEVAQDPHQTTTQVE